MSRVERLVTGMCKMQCVLWWIETYPDVHLAWKFGFEEVESWIGVYENPKVIENIYYYNKNCIPGLLHSKSLFCQFRQEGSQFGRVWQNFLFRPAFTSDHTLRSPVPRLFHIAFTDIDSMSPICNVHVPPKWPIKYSINVSLTIDITQPRLVSQPSLKNNPR